jgi:hypothetical protein
MRTFVIGFIVMLALVFNVNFAFAGCTVMTITDANGNMKMCTVCTDMRGNVMSVFCS